MVCADSNNPTVVDADSKRLLNKIQTIVLMISDWVHKNYIVVKGEETKGRCQKYPGGGAPKFSAEGCKTLTPPKNSSTDM